MTDPDAVRLFLYSEGGQQEKNQTEIIVLLDYFTGLESILPHGLPMDVLYLGSKEKILCQASSKGFLVQQIQLGQIF